MEYTKIVRPRTIVYGEIEYDDNGLPICAICGKSFHRVLTHVSQKHGLTRVEYKERFGLDVGKGICSKISAEKSRRNIQKNYDKCVRQNLLVKGKKTQLKKGHEGRTRDKVSLQTRKRLREISLQRSQRIKDNKICLNTHDPF